MPRKRNGEIPLPDGWDFGRDFDGKVYFIDHITKKTSWIDPRDSNEGDGDAYLGDVAGIPTWLKISQDPEV
ncbi:unnamed protein product [Phaedon cochleariae]|uniref:WW domain-containing protein n=1 Tax=Phaedon cochleariae TaxID=80249 RepID=A0A9N9SF23_PHACE|nr:unnamed protein product [Phaedon cochleariae]